MEKNLYIEIKEKLGASLVEWAENSRTEVIEAENADKELVDMAKKKGLIVPNQDLAFLKTYYCEIGKPNLNGVEITKEAAELGITSAAGQQVNLNHEGFHLIVGWILDAKIEKNLVVIYAVLFKTHMGDYFETVKNMFAEKKLFVSFELHTVDMDGEYIAERREDGIIQVNRMLVSGCGLLIKMEEDGIAPPPACPKAKVLQLLASEDALKNAKKINEKLLTSEDEIIYAEKFLENQKENLKKQEEAKKEEKVDEVFIVEASADQVVEILQAEVDSLEAEYDGGEIEEAKKIKYEERQNLKDEDFALVLTVKNKKTGEPRKIRMFIINDEAHVRNALARLGQSAVQETLKKLGVSVETVKNKILKRAKELKMTDLLEKYKAEIDAMIASGEIVPAQPILLVKETVEEKIVTVRQPKENGDTTSRKGYRITTSEYSDGTSKVHEEEYEDVDTYTNAQLEEKVNAAKAEIEATIPTKIKEEVDKVTAAKDGEIAQLKADAEIKENANKEIIIAKDSEISASKTEIENLKKELATKKFTAEDVQKAKDDTAKIIARRVVLADVNKEISEEELLNDDKFEIRRLKKENEDLKASRGNRPDFMVGAEDNKNDKSDKRGSMGILVDSYIQGMTE